MSTPDERFLDKQWLNGLHRTILDDLEDEHSYRVEHVASADAKRAIRIGLRYIREQEELIEKLDDFEVKLVTLETRLNQERSSLGETLISLDERNADLELQLAQAKHDERRMRREWIKREREIKQQQKGEQ